MNAETERRLAALIMEEAKLMRQKAENDGVSAYLAKPVVKARPNRQFLSAMVRSVQYANRIADIDGMWRQRSVELEYESKGDKPSNSSRNKDSEEQPADRDRHAERGNYVGEASRSSLSSDDDDGLKDEDIEQFLQSRVKRGRGAVGSRMDEPGPYCHPKAGPLLDSRQKEDWEERIARPVAGPSQMPEKRMPLFDSDSARGSKKRRKGKVTTSVDDSGSDGVDRVERKRRRDSKERRRKKEKKKIRESEQHSKKTRKGR